MFWIVGVVDLVHAFRRLRAADVSTARFLAFYFVSPVAD